MSEMVDSAAVMARAISVPLIADTGYGNEINVTRTVREYEARSVAAIHIEDQVAPRRCGHLDGKLVISREEFVSKIRAAVEARRTKEFLIIARTDARAIMDLDEAVWRANAAMDASADMAFVEARRKRARKSPPCRSGCTAPACSMSYRAAAHRSLICARPKRWARKLAILPGLMLKAVIEAGDGALAEIKATFIAPSVNRSDAKTFRRFGADEWDALRTRFNAVSTMEGR